jgi:hypothetical protein
MAGGSRSGKGTVCKAGRYDFLVNDAINATLLPIHRVNMRPMSALAVLRAPRVRARDLGRVAILLCEHAVRPFVEFALGAAFEKGLAAAGHAVPGRGQLQMGAVRVVANELVGRDHFFVLMRLERGNPAGRAWTRDKGVVKGADSLRVRDRIGVRGEDESRDGCDSDLEKWVSLRLGQGRITTESLQEVRLGGNER